MATEGEEVHFLDPQEFDSEGRSWSPASSSGSRSSPLSSVSDDEVPDLDPDCSSPPCYSSVMLEHHVARAVLYAHSESDIQYPVDLLEGLQGLLQGLRLPQNVLRTYHTLSERSFSEGVGTYYGELDYKSRRNGFGAMLYESGDRYYGFWRKNQPQGHGNYFWKGAESGSVYSGQWESGNRKGRGHFLFGPRRQESRLRGSIISGQWQSDRLREQDPSSVLFEENNNLRLETIRPKRDSNSNVEGDEAVGKIRRMIRNLSLKLQ